MSRAGECYMTNRPLPYKYWALTHLDDKRRQWVYSVEKLQNLVGRVFALTGTSIDIVGMPSAWRQREGFWEEFKARIPSLKPRFFKRLKSP